MDPLHCACVLQQTKRDILASDEWEKVVQDLHTFLVQSTERGHSENYEQLSRQKKYKLMKKIAGQLQNTSAFRELQSKVAATVNQALVSIPSFAFLYSGDARLHAHVGERFTSDMLASENAAKACTQLLQQHCHLKYYLRKCFNHPLPAELRATAWKTLLQQKNSFDEQFSSFQEHSEEDKFAEKCKVVLSSSRFLIRSPTIFKALSILMAFYGHCKGSWPSDIEILLCIPFLYVWQNNLRGENKVAESGSVDQMKLSLTDIAQIYFLFMENIDREPNRLTHEVKDLLEAECPALFKHLLKRFGTKADVHIQDIIQQLIQRIFVGEVSMEVVCYIWDQCFIGRMISDIQVLKYFIVSWFIILKHQLMACQTKTDVRRLLSNKQYDIQVSQFQREIEKRFLSQISSQLKVIPFPTDIPSSSGHEQQLSVHSPVWSPPFSFPYPSMREQADPVNSSAHTQICENDMNETEKDCTTRKSHLLEQERESHKRVVEGLTLELELLKQKIEGSLVKSSHFTGFITSPALVASEPFNTESSSIPDASHSVMPSSERSDSVNLQESGSSKSLVSLAESVVADKNLQEDPSFASKLNRPFSPNNITKDDVTQIWFTIFKRFSSAVDLVFHGTKEDRLELISSMQKKALLHHKEDRSSSVQ